MSDFTSESSEALEEYMDEKNEMKMMIIDCLYGMKKADEEEARKKREHEGDND